MASSYTRLRANGFRKSILNMTTLSQQEIDRINLNLETSRIAWEELQRFFASGKAIFVSGTLDLIDVAIQISGTIRSK